MTPIDYPATACIARFQVPGFSTPMPTVIDTALTPPEVLAQLAPSWLQAQQPGQDVALYRLHQPIIGADGALRDAAGQLYRPSLAGRAAETLADLAGLPDLPHLNATGLLCKPPLQRDLSTWLLNALPTAWLTRHRLPPTVDASNAIFIIDDAADPLRQAMVDSLQCLPPPMPVATFLPSMHLQVSDLIVSDGLHRPSPLAIDALHALTSAIPVGPPQALFFSTTHSDAPHFCAAEADAIARAAGWTVIHPARRNFREIVALCKGALIIAGIAGPDLTYAAFARRGTPLLAFAPAASAGTSLWHLAALRQHRYTEIRCAQHADQPDRPAATRDLTMPPATLNAHLRQALADAGH